MPTTLNKSKNDQPVGYNLINNNGLGKAIKAVTNNAPITAKRNKFDLLTKIKTWGLNSTDFTKYVITQLNAADEQRDPMALKKYLGMLGLDRKQIDTIVTSLHVEWSHRPQTLKPAFPAEEEPVALSAEDKPKSLEP